MQELAQVVMKLIGQHPEGVEVLKMAFDELYGLEVAEYEEEEDPYTPVGPEAEPVRGPIGFKESLARIVKEEVSKALKEYTEVDPIGRAQQRLDRAPFTEWLAQVEELGFQFGEDSPNPYGCVVAKFDSTRLCTGRRYRIRRRESEEQSVGNLYSGSWSRG